METPVALFLIAVSLGLVTKIVLDALRKRVEILSIRNFLFIGFIVFQCIAAAVPLLAQYYPRYVLENPSNTAVRYAVLMSIFLVLFIILYDTGPFVAKCARRMPRSTRVPDIWKLLLLASICLALSAILRFGVLIPLINILTTYTGLALASMAAGIAGWVWAPRLMNPAVAIVAIVIVLSALSVTITSSFGRRGLVSVCVCVGWGMYYSHFRTISKARYLPYLAIVTAVGVLFIAVFTSVRGTAHGKNYGPLDYAKLIATQGDPIRGLTLLAGGQETGHVSMWLMEVYPESYEFEDMMGLAYTAMVPVPRGWWLDKPVPISLRIPKMAKLRHVQLGSLTIGPGILGTAWADGGWYPIIIYAAFFALAFRLLDEWVRLNPTDLTVILPVGAALGEVIAIPRGEVALFTFIYFYALTTSWLALRMAAPLLRFQRITNDETAIQATTALAPPDLESHAELDDPDALQNEEQWSEPLQERPRLDWAELAEGEAFEAPERT